MKQVLQELQIIGRWNSARQIVASAHCLATSNVEFNTLAHLMRACVLARTLARTKRNDFSVGLSPQSPIRRTTTSADTKKVAQALLSVANKTHFRQACKIQPPGMAKTSHYMIWVPGQLQKCVKVPHKAQSMRTSTCWCSTCRRNIMWGSWTTTGSRRADSQTNERP